MRLFDTHAHLDLPRFGGAEEQRSAAIRAQDAEIAAILIPGMEPRSWPRTVAAANALGAETPSVRFHTAFGVHPHALRDLSQNNDQDLESRLLDALGARPPSLVAIGECGLDFRHLPGIAAHERQVAVFEAHLRATRRTGLPLLIHCVRAHGVMVERLLAEPTPPALLHAFSGSAEIAARLCGAGHFISFAGSITLPGARRPLRCAAAVPSSQLLIETDSPDQTPFGRRPARNEPAFLIDVAAALASARGVTTEEIAALTTANACRALGVTLPEADPR